MVTVSTICGKSSLGRIENQLCGQSGSMSAMFASSVAVVIGDVRRGHLAGNAVVAVVEVTRVGGGDGEGDRCAPAVRLALMIASRNVPSPVSPVLVTTKLGPPKTATGENSEVLLSGPEPVSVMLVAVAVMNGWSAGTAGRFAEKLAWPFASVVTLIVPRNVLPPANSSR